MDYETRAQDKLADIRSGRSNDEQVGRTPVEIFAGMMVAALFAVPPLVAGVLAFSGRADLGPVTALLLMAFALVLGGAILYFFLRNAPTTPEVALGLFMHRIATRNYAGAWTFVVNGDKDDAPRRAGGREFSFGRLKGFAEYWDHVLDQVEPAIHTGHVFMGEHAVRRIGPDLAAVTFSLASPDGHPGTEHTKLLVRLEDEWRIFNGAWAEAEETDLAWTQEAQPAQAHAWPAATAPAAAA